MKNSFSLFKVKVYLLNFFFSLGGFTALVSAAALRDQVKGVVLLNSAGQFGDASSGTNDSEETALQKFIVKPLKEIFQRVVLGFLFWQAKRPARIESVLKSVRLSPWNLFWKPLLFNSISKVNFLNANASKNKYLFYVLIQSFTCHTINLEHGN